MTDILNKLVEQAAEKGMKTAESVANFAYEQSPLLCEEVIRWGWMSEIGAPLLGFLLIVAVFIVHFKFKNHKNYSSGEDCFILNIIALIVGILVFVCQIVDVLYPLVAPRLYLLEKFSQLIK